MGLPTRSPNVKHPWYARSHRRLDKYFCCCHGDGGLERQGAAAAAAAVAKRADAAAESIIGKDPLDEREGEEAPHSNTTMKQYLV